MFESVGCIGLGIMGKPMAKNLLKAGYSLVVHNRSQQAVHELIGLGAKAAHSPRAVAEQVSVVITMLPNSPDVEQVALGAEGLVHGAHEGLVYVDMSTISPIVVKKIGASLATKGVSMLDAPVSGGEKGAVEANLSIMVGGDKSVFERVLPIFQALGKTITHLGPLGAGSYTKLANQIIVAVNLTAIAEALVFARKADLDLATTIKALSGGMAASRCLELKTPNYLQGSYAPGFRADLHFKDLGLILEAGRSLSVPLPTTAVVQELFHSLRARGRGGLDHSGIITLLEELAGMERSKNA